MLTAVERPGAAGMTYDVAGPEPLSFAELLRVCARAVASRTRFVPVPLTPVIALASGFERVSQHPPIRAEQLRRLAEDKAFGSSPRSVTSATRRARSPMASGPRPGRWGWRDDRDRYRAAGTLAGTGVMTGADLALLGRTVVHLQPAQVAHRARLRAQRTALQRWPQLGRRLLAGPDPCDAVGWPAGFRPLDANGPQDLAGRWTWPAWPSCCRTGSRCWARPGRWAIRPTGGRPTRRSCGASTCITGTGPGPWRPARTGPPHGRSSPGCGGPGGCRSPSATPTRGIPTRRRCAPGRGAGCTAELVAGSDLEPSFAAELAAHAGFLRRHLETDVGGNHLIKDLKALAGLAVFFADDRLLRRALTRLSRQLAVQVLPDGGHYERAPGLSLPGARRPHRHRRPGRRARGPGPAGP